MFYSALRFRPQSSILNCLQFAVWICRVIGPTDFADLACIDCFVEVGEECPLAPRRLIILTIVVMVVLVTGHKVCRLNSSSGSRPWSWPWSLSGHDCNFRWGSRSGPRSGPRSGSLSLHCLSSQNDLTVPTLTNKSLQLQRLLKFGWLCNSPPLWLEPLQKRWFSLVFTLVICRPLFHIQNTRSYYAYERNKGRPIWAQ